MKKNFIIINILLGLLFIGSIIAFAFLLKLTVLWKGVELQMLWSPGANLDKATEFQNSLYIPIIAVVFSALSAIASAVMFCLLNFKIWKEKKN